MRGSPPLHLALLLLAFGLVAVPLIRLTGASQAPAALPTQETTAQSKEVPVRVVLRHAAAPLKLELLHGEKNLLEGIDWKTSPVELDVDLVLGTDGLELTLEAQWSEQQAPTPITVELEPDGEQRRSETRWSEDGQISDVLTYLWR